MASGGGNKKRQPGNRKNREANVDSNLQHCDDNSVAHNAEHHLMPEQCEEPMSTDSHEAGTFNQQHLGPAAQYCQQKQHQQHQQQVQHHMHVQHNPSSPHQHCSTQVHDHNISESLHSHTTTLSSLNTGFSGPVPYNWQASKTNVKDRLAFMFNNEVMSDVHFVVGKEMNTQRIPAHKFVLSVGSAVFDAMFNGAMATTSEDIELPDVEPAAFLALLRFLYSDEVHIDAETVMTTLYTAKKYAVPALETACVDFLKKNLCSDNAFMLLTQARLFDEPQLAGLCLETIDKNTYEALSAEGFTDIDRDTLCVVLERDTLGIRESKLFSAVCRWAEAECQRHGIAITPENQRQVLGPALQQIRFPLMSVEEFAMGPAQSNLLQDRETVQLFLYFTVNPKPTVPFLDVPRCCLTGKEQVVSRFCQIESRWGYSGTSDRIRFMVNRRIFVVGFGLYGSIHGPAEYVVNIQIICTDTGKIGGQSNSTFQCDGSNSTFRLMFKEPVEILPNINYTACATLKGPDSYYGTKGLRKVTHESPTSGKVTFQFTYAAGNNNGTSVEDGQIPEIIFYT
ncbi:BTB/POZ domain-containing protein 1 [Lingula anatina]|uniref:BTB/POZ domain-containing protein 1 n=1 Tax=Lingula anatina TaxID=7574 RepID=A0A1S3HVW3_LINAN|nr:BTB/POZ domain-containing protein 1 [Lingula anatina]XP_013390159.1 BTB/POZ domain-containing protein 1 [Lingula anatina]|eukprot:XP_013390158.1 BTB/POZ domain-containing protein 1 [Lingula anatina]